MIGWISWLFITMVFGDLGVVNVTKFHKADISMLGDRYTVGFVDIRLNDTLHVFRPHGDRTPFQNRTCRSNNDPCPPCDWTDPTICAGSRLNSSCPCVANVPMCFPNRFPNGYNLWRDSPSIEVGFFGVITIAFHPPLPQNNCSCMLIKYDVLDGAIAGIVMFYGDTWTGNSGPNVLTRYGTTTLCPNDPKWLNSFVIAIVGYTKMELQVFNRVNLSVEFVPLPNAYHDPTCTVPTEYASTHQCLPTGVHTVLAPNPGTQYIRAIIQPPASERCGILGLWTSYDEFILSTNPWVSPQNSSGAYFTHREAQADSRLTPGIYRYCLQPQEALYIYMLAPKPLDFYVDTSQEWMYLSPISAIGPNNFYKTVLGAVTAYCPGKNFTAHRNVYPPSENMDTGSANLRLLYPSDDYDIFTPPPLFASDEYYLTLQLPRQPIDSQRIVISVLLEQRLRAQKQPINWGQPWQQNAYRWLTLEQWEQCTFRMGGPLADSQGRVLDIHIAAQKDTALTCDPRTYSQLSMQVDMLQDTADELAQSSDANQVMVYDLWFKQDRIMSSNAFYACRRLMDSYYTPRALPTKTILSKECLAPLNSSAFHNDTCCILNASTLYSDCEPQLRELPAQNIIATYTSALDTCQTKQCTRASLLDLVLDVNAKMNPNLCHSTVDLPDDKLAFYHCMQDIFGPESLSFPGVACSHDTDCTSGQCDVYSRRCLPNITVAEVELVRCIYGRLTQFGRLFVSRELGLDPNAADIQEQWINAFSEILPCSHPHVPTGFGVQVLVYGRCQGCMGYVSGASSFTTIWTLSPGSSFPIGGRDCWSCRSAECSASQTSITDVVHCNMLGCNIMPAESRISYPFISTTATCSNATICGVSDDGFFYRNVTDTIPVSNCNGSLICMLADGGRLAVTTAGECQSLYTCDVCPTCTDSTTCQQAGVCSDASDYDNGIWIGSYAGYTAGCFFSIAYKEPFNPTVTICNPPFRSTIFGCSTYTVSKDDCLSGNFSWGDPSVYQLSGPRWITRATSQQECEAHGTVCNDRSKPLPGIATSYTNTYSFSEDCVHTQPLYTWRSGRWLPGQVRYPRVVTGAVRPRHSPTPRIGMNLQHILGNITKASNKLDSLKAQSAMYCYGGYKKSLDQLVCSCILGYNESFCYTDKNNVSSVGVMCDEAGVITAGALSLYTNKDSLPPATCSNLFFSVSSIVAYSKSVITPLRTLIVNYEEDTEYAVRNEQLAVYGKVLTDGYSAVFDTRVINVTLCMAVSSLRSNYKSGKYSRLDLAYKHNDRLMPMNVSVSDTEGVFCANLSEFRSQIIYHFIQRVPHNYTTISRTVFSDSEIAFLAVLLTLYSLGLIPSTYRFGVSFYSIVMNYEGAAYLVKRFCVVAFLMMAFFAFRVALFSLLLSNGLLGAESTRAVVYLLFEFPILLYFAFVTNYVGIYFSMIRFGNNVMVHIDKYVRTLKLINLLTVIFNLIVFVLFVVMIILFQTIIASPYVACGGTVYIFDSEQAYALLLVYRCIFSSIAICVGLMLFVSAAWFTWFMSSNTDLRSMMSWSTRVRTIALSIVGGLGLVCQAVYFLIITAKNETPVNFASLSILLVLETLPALLFVLAEPMRKAKKSSKSADKKSNGIKSSGSNESGGFSRVILTPKGGERATR